MARQVEAFVANRIHADLVRFITREHHGASEGALSSDDPYSSKHDEAEFWNVLNVMLACHFDLHDLGSAFQSKLVQSLPYNSELKNEFASSSNFLEKEKSYILADTDIGIAYFEKSAYDDVLSIGAAFVEAIKKTSADASSDKKKYDAIYKAHEDSLKTLMRYATAKKGLIEDASPCEVPQYNVDYSPL